jgi:hypothetical protein
MNEFCGRMNLYKTSYTFNNTNRKFFMQHIYGVFGTIFLEISTFLSLPPVLSLSLFLCLNR